MTKYYLERVKDGERQVAFAKIGYEQTIKALGERLAKCESEKEQDEIIDEIKASKKAMKALEDSYEYNLKQYREEGGKN